MPAPQIRVHGEPGAVSPEVDGGSGPQTGAPVSLISIRRSNGFMVNRLWYIAHDSRWNLVREATIRKVFRQLHVSHGLICGLVHYGLA